MEVKGFKGKILIVAIWIVFMLVAAFAFYAVEDGLYMHKAKTELVEQAQNITKQFPSLIQNDLYADIGAAKVLFSKLEGLAFKLEDYETIEDARQFLDDYVAVAGTESIAILDRNADLIYGSEELQKKENLDAFAVQVLLDEKLYRTSAEELRNYTGYSKLMEKSFLHDDSEHSSGISTWGVGDRWVIILEAAQSDAQKNVHEYFDWRNALQKITIGNTGSLVAIRTDDGKILSCADESLVGTMIGDLGMTDSEFGEIKGPEDLLSVFSTPDTVRTLTVTGVRKLATRLDIENGVILALLPVGEVTADVWGATLGAELLIGLVTGLFVLYALLYAGFESRSGLDGKNRHLYNKLRIAGIIVVGIVLLFSMYLNALTSYAYKFRYSKTKVNNVVSFMNDNDNEKKELQEWFDQEYLERARIAKCILDHTEREAVTREYMAGLSKALDIRYTYLFDGSGSLVLTNSRYDKISIGDSSPFHPLLEGKTEIVLAPAYDELRGEILENVGISMVDNKGNGEGVLVTMTNPAEPQYLEENLGYMDAFRQVSLTNNSYIMAIDSETMDICYMATIIDGSYVVGDGSFDYKGMNISVLGMDQSKITDGFNGNIMVNRKLYFASIKRGGEHFFIVMKPQFTTDSISIFSVLMASLAATVFVVAVALVFSRKKSMFNGAKVLPNVPEKAQAVLSSFEDQMEGMIGDMQRRNTLYFDMRWPEDCRKWKDKSPGQKFSVLSRYVLIVAMVVILIQSRIASSDSIWYYCINGEWDSGVNLYSITRCLLVAGILIVAKMVIHKLLFWIARAARPRGETLCNLLDNFNVYVLSITGLFLCLSYCGVNTKALTLTGGAVGVIFGIGCQTIVADILAGLIMSLEGVAHNGDMVMFDGKPEVIQSIGVRTIRLRWQDGVKTVRNNEFRNHILLSRDRIEITTADLAVDWSVKYEKIEKILEKELPPIGEKLREAYGESLVGPKFRGIQELRTDAVVLSFVIICNYRAAKKAKLMLYKELKLMCERNKINPPVPQIAVTETKD